MTLDREELLYAAKRLESLKPPKLYSDLFPKQKAAIKDASSRVSIICSRRSGKSRGMGAKLFANGFKFKDAIIPYVGLTRRSAKNIMWPTMKKIRDKFDFKCEFKDSTLEILMPSGSSIQLFGADQENFIDRLRGPSYPFAGIDEGQAFGPHLHDLIEDVLTPALLDYNGQLMITGTPGVVPAGYFYEATQGKHGFSPHHWTVLDNVYIPHAKKFIEDLKLRNAWTDENPTYLREWCGKWAEDLSALIYKYTEKNDYNFPLNDSYTRILSVDYGYDDQTAFCIVAFRYDSPIVYIEHVEGHSEWVPSQIGNRIKQLQEKYNPIKIVADTGALGKMITEEMRRRFNLPMIAAEKKDKLTWISFMNGGFIDDTLKVKSSLDKLKHQLKTLIRDPKDPKKEDPNMPNDLCDAALYAYREAKNYHPTAPDKRKPIEKYEASIIEALEREAISEDDDTFDYDPSQATDHMFD